MNFVNTLSGKKNHILFALIIGEAIKQLHGLRWVGTVMLLLKAGAVSQLHESWNL